MRQDGDLGHEAPLARRRLPGKGQETGGGGHRLECGGRAQACKPLPEKLAKIWAEEWTKEGEKIDWERLMPPRGFRVLPRRWVVERTFSWLSHNRRMTKDYERLCASAEAFTYAAMIRLMVRRLARA